MRAVAFLALLLLCPRPSTAEIRWLKDWDRARADALHAHRPILLDFWASWCGPCNTMDQEVFSQERIAVAMKKVMPVRVDVDRQPALARKYGVRGTPVLLVTDGYGNELFRHSGFLAADQLEGLLKELPTDLNRVHACGEVLAKDKHDFAALKGYGDELRRHALYRASNEYYRRALKTTRGRERAEPRAEILLALASNYAALNETAEAAKIREQHRREYSRK